MQLEAAALDHKLTLIAALAYSRRLLTPPCEPACFNTKLSVAVS